MKNTVHTSGSDYDSQTASLAGDLFGKSDAMRQVGAHLHSKTLFFNAVKTARNEQQFAQRLEAACGDPVTASALVAAQKRKRISYESGRLAVRFAVKDLTRRCQDFYESARAVKTGLPRVKDASQRRRLATHCLELVREAQAFGPAYLQQISQSCEPPSATSASASQALDQAYSDWLNQVWIDLTIPKPKLAWPRLGDPDPEPSAIPDPAILTYSPSRPKDFSASDPRPYVRSDEDFEPVRMTFVWPQWQGPMSRYHVTVQGLIEIANQALACTNLGSPFGVAPDEDLERALTAYPQLKSALNEPQYWQRLEQAIASGDGSKVMQLNKEQQLRRQEYFSCREVLKHFQQESLKHADTVLASLRQVLEQLTEDQAKDKSMDPEKVAALKNNLLAAHNVLLLILQANSALEKELTSTEALTKGGEEALFSALAEIISSLPTYGTPLSD